MGYPTSIVAFATHNSGDTIQAADTNNPDNEIVAIETGLINGFQHNAKPFADNTYDLGTASLAWKNLWTKGTTQFNGVAYTWPAADGSANQFLQTNGSKTLSWATQASSFIFQEFRLTLTTGVSVTTSDVTAATTLYFSPHVGRRCTVFDGSGNVTILTSAEISIAVPATTSQMYDVFVYNNSGTLTLELLAWTNDTTRATAIVKTGGVDAAGVYTKSGDTTRRYVGSFRTTTVSGQTEDSAVKRYVWNYYNRVDKSMLRQETTATWTYQTATIRQANAAPANQLDVVIGVAEDTIPVSIGVIATAAARQVVSVGVGLNSTTTYHASNIGMGTSLTGSDQMLLWAMANLFPPVGRNTLTWLEWTNTGALTTFYGLSPTNFPSGFNNSGISAVVRC